MLSNLKNSFDYIGIMGASSNKLSDFVPVQWPVLSSNPDSNNILLKIYYSKIGASVNPQY
jgi:hypothetical protein